MKYKVGQIIKILGSCDTKLVGGHAKIRDILYDEYYLVELLDCKQKYYTPWLPWSISLADTNSELHIAKTILYGDKND
jgi:hypothetical protein